MPHGIFVCFVFYLQMKYLCCVEVWERSFSALSKPSNSTAASLLQEVSCPSVIVAMAFCSDNPECASFDFDSARNVSKQYYTQQDAGRYLVRGRECPSRQGFHYAKELGMCFWAHPGDKLGWEDARKSCQRVSGDLISLDTGDKLRYVKKIYNDESGGYWLGGYMVGGVWKWVSGVPLRLDNPFWYPNQPDDNNGRQNRLRSTNRYFGFFGLDDGTPHVRSDFICEIFL